MFVYKIEGIFINVKRIFRIVLSVILITGGCDCGKSTTNAEDEDENIRENIEEGFDGLFDLNETENSVDFYPDEISGENEQDLLDLESDILDTHEDENSTFVYPPNLRGPFYAGVRTLREYFSDYSKWLDIMIWYPALAPPPGTQPYKYMWILQGNAYENQPVDPYPAPHPIILFSHGNKGINFQSFTLTEHLASHGFIVAAPNHPGNTLFDNPSDEEIARIALERPYDIAFTYDKVVALNRNPSDIFYGKVDESAVGMLGHSFGGYTTLMIAGATINVDNAKERCASGEIDSTFCNYINVWPAGEIVSRPPTMWIVKAAVPLAPGGYQAFYDDGLANVDVPVMIFGGTLDEWCTLEDEIRPIYNALPSPAYKIEIEGAGHMSFTDICRIPGSILIPELAQMCDPSVYIDLDRAFEITNTFTTAFFRYYIENEEGMSPYLSPDFASTCPEIDFAIK